MDIAKRLILAAARDPKSEAAALMLDAVNHIEALRNEVRIQRCEIAQHISVRNALLDMDAVPEKDSCGDL
jgi:hypothetical protein